MSGMILLIGKKEGLLTFCGLKSVNPHDQFVQIMFLKKKHMEGKIEGTEGHLERRECRKMVMAICPTFLTGEVCPSVEVQ